MSLENEGCKLSALFKAMAKVWARWLFPHLSVLKTFCKLLPCSFLARTTCLEYLWVLSGPLPFSDRYEELVYSPALPSSIALPALLFIEPSSINHIFFLPGVSAPILKTIILYNFSVSDISWRRFETNAYYFSDTEENWEMAKEKCAEHDSHLVIINTKKEQVNCTYSCKE